MKILVFSDIHGNLTALKTMLEKTDYVDGYICLGDMVNYGPWGDECVELICSLPNIVLLEGNHEKAFLKGSYDGADKVVKQFFKVCYKTFSNFDKISNLKKSYSVKDYTFKHTIFDKNIYQDSAIKLDHNYVIGHSHHQFRMSQPPFVLYNTGSVGQNRKYINLINFLILETENMSFEMKSMTYDVGKVLNEMMSRNYPKQCIDYYNDKLQFKKIII